jgi:putative transposase
LTIKGERPSLWRAVDQDDHVLDILVQRRRTKPAAKKVFRQLLKGWQYVPRVIITDTLTSYGATKRARLPGVEHRQNRSRNRCEHRIVRPVARGVQGLQSWACPRAFSPSR